MYRKNTAGQHLGFLLLNASTGAVMTGQTPAVHLSIDGAAQASGGGTVVEIGLGQYSYALAQPDTNGNQISVLFSVSGALSVEKTILTTAADPTNAASLGLTNLDAAVSSRLTYAGGAVSSVTGSVASVASPVTVGTNSDKTGYSLSAAGLDAVTTTEPDTGTNGAVSTWNFRMLLRWAIMCLSSGSRTLSSGSGALVVKKLAGTQSTTQPIADDGAGNESLGPPS